jgi:RimJ/RimL family protein N-acetyltransferase
MYSLGFDRWFDLALASKSEIPFVVHVGGVPVGSTRYLNVEPFHRRAEIGWTWLERAQWGTGANIETKYLLLRNAFDRAGFMRVEFKTDARNLRVRGALLGIGGTFEGIFRKHMILPDSIRDSAWYAIVDDDWPRVRALLEAKIEKHLTA